MFSSQISQKNKDTERRDVMVRRPFDQLFDNFRQDIQDAFFAPFINPLSSVGMPRGMDSIEGRIPLCDVIDKGDKEVPDIQKDQIELKATDEHITFLLQKRKEMKRKKEVMF